MARKVIGVLGGMGPEATRDLYDRIIRHTPARCDQDHLRVIIDSDPQIPDRTAAIVAGGPDPVPEMLASLRVLAAAGADFAIIPCVSAHYFLDRLRAASPVPILSIYDAVAEAVLATPLRRVELLATDGTIQGGRFEQALAARGIAVIVPDEAVQREVMAAIYAIKAGTPPEPCRAVTGRRASPGRPRRRRHRRRLHRGAARPQPRGPRSAVLRFARYPRGRSSPREHMEWRTV